MAQTEPIISQQKNAEPALSASSAPYLISLIFNNLQIE